MRLFELVIGSNFDEGVREILPWCKKYDVSGVHRHVKQNMNSFVKWEDIKNIAPKDEFSWFEFGFEEKSSSQSGIMIHRDGKEMQCLCLLRDGQGSLHSLGVFKIMLGKNGSIGHESGDFLFYPGSKIEDDFIQGIHKFCAGILMCVLLSISNMNSRTGIQPKIIRSGH